VVAALLVIASVAATAFFYSRGQLLWFGDALAHLNIARRILDSRTPGWAQVGTTWLPLPHLLMLPFARIDWLWHTGLAGSIVSGACFVAAGLFLFGAVRRTLGSLPAACATALFASNPNVLFLQSLAMTEAPFFAALFGLLYFTVRFAETQALLDVALAGLCSAAANFTRYEGWFLVPFVTLYFLLAAGRRRLLAAFLFGFIASSTPAIWLAHNYWYFSDALAFYHGPYSAKVLYQNQLAGGMQRYAGDGDWPLAWLYYSTAARLDAGTTLYWMGLAGLLAALFKRRFWPVLLLLLPAVFYIWSMHGSGTPIFVPNLWPATCYNTRYGLAAFGLILFGAASLVAIAPERLRGLAAGLVLAVALVPWLVYPRAENWVCFREAKENSVARRASSAEAVRFLHANLRPGDTILMNLGMLSEIPAQAHIPFRRILHEGNGPLYMASLQRPDLFLRENWAITIAGDNVATALQRAPRRGVKFECVKIIAIPGAPVVEIYRRLK
jgi:hypothetical protein